MLNRLIKTFCFQEDFRSQLVFSDTDKIRLNTENKADQKIMLKGSPFSTDDDIYVETWMIDPMAVKRWLGFEVVYKQDERWNEFGLPQGTSVGVRIKTTAGHYFYNGVDWVVAGPGEWNTDVEIRANIDTFPIATIGNKKIGIVLNLKTTDPGVTPEIYAVKILGEFDIEYFDDLVYDSVIRLLNTQFRSTSVVVFNTDVSSISSIGLDSILENKGYNIFDVKSVFNVTDDPLKLSNLHDSYTVGNLKKDGFTYEPGTETFNASIPAGKWVEIVFEYVPEISVKVNQDYFEEPSYPHIVFTRITEVARRGFMMQNTNGQSDAIKDVENGVAVQQLSPSQKSYRFDFMLYTHEIDQFKLLDGLRRFFANTKKLVTYGLANEHALQIVDEIDTVGNSTTSDSSDTNLAKGSFDVLGVLFHDKLSIDVPLVAKLNLDITKQTL